MNALIKLIEYGYIIELNGDEIKFTYKGDSPPETDKIKVYCEKIRNNKEYYVNILKVAQNLQMEQGTKVLHYEYKELNKNRIKIGSRLSKILKGIYKGENIYELFLELIYIVSSALGETVTYETAKKNLVDIYGVSLKHTGKALGKTNNSNKIV